MRPNRAVRSGSARFCIISRQKKLAAVAILVTTEKAVALEVHCSIPNLVMKLRFKA